MKKLGFLGRVLDAVYVHVKQGQIACRREMFHGVDTDSPSGEALSSHDIVGFFYGTVTVRP